MHWALPDSRSDEYRGTAAPAAHRHQRKHASAGGAAKGAVFERLARGHYNKHANQKCQDEHCTFAPAINRAGAPKDDGKDVFERLSAAPSAAQQDTAAAEAAAAKKRAARRHTGTSKARP